MLRALVIHEVLSIVGNHLGCFNEELAWANFILIIYIALIRISKKIELHNIRGIDVNMSWEKIWNNPIKITHFAIFKLDRSSFMQVVSNRKILSELDEFHLNYQISVFLSDQQPDILNNS